MYKVQVDSLLLSVCRYEQHFDVRGTLPRIRLVPLELEPWPDEHPFYKTRRNLMGCLIVGTRCHLVVLRKVLFGPLKREH